MGGEMFMKKAGIRKLSGSSNDPPVVGWLSSDGRRACAKGRRGCIPKNSGMRKPDYPFTASEEANALLAASGTALLIGLCLEQQVPSQKALAGPFVLKERIGHLDARKIAAMRPAAVDKAFREKPAIHRFPGMMAKRVQQLCQIIADEYGNRGDRVWEKVTKASELFDRLRALPGFGDEKAACGVRILAAFGGHATTGWQRYASAEAMPWIYKDGKRVEA